MKEGGIEINSRDKQRKEVFRELKEIMKELETEP